jgi:hypothetical protein
MPIDPKDVTNGYWYVKNGEHHDIVFVEGSVAWRFGFSLSTRLSDLDFIAPVPAPPAPETDFESTEQLLVRLRKELNLSPTAPIMQIFRKAAVLAREAADKAKQDNP